MTHVFPRNGNTALPTDQSTQLPILSINSMSEGQLRDMIPMLLKLVQSDMLDKTRRPDWWPNDLPWSENQTYINYQQASWVETLRNVIRCCYKHLGQEKLLQESSKDKIKTSYNSTLPASSSLLACLQQNTIVSGKKIEKAKKRRYSEIYICFFCEREFSVKSEMRAHQIICDDRPPELLAVSISPKELSPKEGNLPPVMSPAKINLNEAFDNHISKDKYVKTLGIVQKQKAARILARHRCSSKDINFTFDFDEPETPISPPTPRTPKLLISQLSKEDNASSSRKRLSYSQEEGEVNDKESVRSHGSNDEERPSHVNKSLFNIDVSSVLGQRVVKYMKDETNLVILRDSESFCRTPDKNEYYDKLRNRSNQYPIIYKPRKTFDLAHTYRYKFTRKHKQKMTRKVPKTKKKPKKKLVNLPHSKVVLKKLTKTDLKKWLPKSEADGIIEEVFFDENNNKLFPKVPILHSEECDKLLGLKRRSLKRLYKSKDPLSLTNVVSEDDNAEVSKQKLTVYRCLLSEITELHSGKKPEVPRKEKPKPRWSSSKYKQWKSKDKLGHLTWLKSETALAEADVEKRLTDFHNKKVSLADSIDDFQVKRCNDDNISILSLSMSSDDDSYNSHCCAECRRKKRCSVSTCVPSDKSTCSCSKTELVSPDKCLREMSNVNPSSDQQHLTPLFLPVICNSSCSDSQNSDTDNVLKCMPSPPPSAQKKSQNLLTHCSETYSEGKTTDSENSLAFKKSSPYKLRVSSPKKSYPDFEMYFQRKIPTTALGERFDHLCNQNNSPNAQTNGVLAVNKPIKICSSPTQPALDLLRRSKRNRSPSSSLCSDSPAKLRKLETR